MVLWGQLRLHAPISLFEDSYLLANHYQYYFCTEHTLPVCTELVFCTHLFTEHSQPHEQQVSIISHLQERNWCLETFRASPKGKVQPQKVTPETRLCVGCVFTPRCLCLTAPLRMGGRGAGYLQTRLSTPPLAKTVGQERELLPPGLMPSRLTPAEARGWVFPWCSLASPLLIFKESHINGSITPTSYLKKDRSWEGEKKRKKEKGRDWG